MAPKVPLPDYNWAMKITAGKISLTSLPKQAFCSLTLSLLCLGQCPPTWAANAFAEGVQAYGQRNYNLALTKLSDYLRTSPGHADANYYLAATYAALKRQPEAKRQYAYVLKAFPGTKAAKYSLQAMARMNDNQYMTTVVQQVATEAKTKAANVQEERIPLRRSNGGHLMVRVRVNGKPCEFAFDTGASGTCITQEAWQRLGNELPREAPTGKASGVGGEVGTWCREAEIEMGRIKRKLPLIIVPNMPFDGVVGQTFFQDMQYNLSGSSDYIHIFSGASTAASRSVPMNTVDIPFTRVGNNLQVDVRINGRPIQMLFDTGATNTVVTATMAKQMDLKPTGDFTVGQMTGVGAASQILVYNVDSIALGPVVKRNISIWVGGDGFNLLGQNFFGDQRYVIDNDKNVIHFLR